MRYKIIHIGDGSRAYLGSFSRKKCKKILESLEGKEKMKMVKDIESTPGHPGDNGTVPQFSKSQMRRRKITTEMIMNPPPGPDIVVDPDVNKYSHRTSIFSSKEAVTNVLNKLDITDYVIKVDKNTGFFALYNDND